MSDVIAAFTRPLPGPNEALSIFVTEHRGVFLVAPANPFGTTLTVGETKCHSVQSVPSNWTDGKWAQQSCRCGWFVIDGECPKCGFKPGVSTQWDWCSGCKSYRRTVETVMVRHPIPGAPKVARELSLCATCKKVHDDYAANLDDYLVEEIELPDYAGDHGFYGKMMKTVACPPGHFSHIEWDEDDGYKVGILVYACDRDGSPLPAKVAKK